MSCIFERASFCEVLANAAGAPMRTMIRFPKTQKTSVLWSATLLTTLSIFTAGCPSGEVDCVEMPSDPACSSEPEPTPSPAPTQDAGIATQDAGIATDAGAPTDGGCSAGTEGCACESGTCTDGSVCTDGICETIPCVDGALGCVCGFAGFCDAVPGELVDCVANLCVVVVDDTPTPGVPSDDCHTPCSDHLDLPDGTFRFCSSEGWMEGCIAGLVCTQGSCLEEGETPATCEVASECPGYQACIMGLCRSNCSGDTDCAEGARCDSYVCRKECTTTESSCGAGERCESSNGLGGVCMPTLVEDVDAYEATDSMMFSLERTSLSFTNNLISNVFYINNLSDSVMVLNVKKEEHSFVDTDGRTVERDLPLFWMDMGVGDVASRVQSLEVEVLPGEQQVILLDAAFNEALSVWDGRIRVGNDKLGYKDISLTYSTRPDGEWSGNLYTFMDFNDYEIDLWAAAMRNNTGDVRELATNTQNAFIAKWTDFRQNTSFTKRQWDAVFSATISGNWDNGTVRSACSQANPAPDVICYLYASPNAQSGDTGTRVYTEDPLLRVPTGVIEMPVTLRLQEDLAETFTYGGRVESSATLQTPGFPPVHLSFGEDPASCGEASAGSCLVQVNEFSVDALIGGRFIDDGLDCANHNNFEAKDTPWLIESFSENTLTSGGRLVRRECREKAFPVANTVLGSEALNLSFAGANPIADGRVRKRTTRLLDGLLINQDTLFLLVQETFSANLTDDNEHPADFSAYGILELRRSGANIETGGYTPGVLPEEGAIAEPVSKLDSTCSLDLIRDALGDPSAVVAGNEEAIATVLLTGLPKVNPPTPISDMSIVHYLCHDTGRFDGGFDAWVELGGEDCPLGSNITYFIYSGDVDLQNEDCNGTLQNRCTLENGCTEELAGTCGLVLDGLVSSEQAVLNPAVICLDDFGQPDVNSVSCSENRADLLDSKEFYAPKVQPSDQRVFTPLAAFIDDAFRYKSQFTTRDGNTPGFVPTECTLSGNRRPYCYDPKAIEEAKDRVTCLLDLYTSSSIEGTPVETSVEAFLRVSFAKSGSYDGFEHLYAELLIMLGDEDFTNALASRFDLAGSTTQLFEGDLFEPEGIQMAGGAGNEMMLLYRSRQYFQLVLDRFHQVSPTLWQGVSGSVTNPVPNVIGFESIPTYFHRLSLASARKAKIAGEIAKKYQSFNEPDLARHVVEKAYAEAYIESVELTQFMRRTINVVDTAQVDGLRYEISLLHRKYNQALSRMREQYVEIVNDVTFFGDPPDFIPFPAPGFNNQTSVEIMLDRAFSSANIAAGREVRALDSNRAFDVDSAVFQSELAKLHDRYEGQLSDLCGTMEGYDQLTIYPAILKYAEFNPIASFLGNPCGLTGTGRLHDAMIRLEGEAHELRVEIIDIQSIFADVEIEETRIQNECNGRVSISQMSFDVGEVINLAYEVDQAQNMIQGMQRELRIIDAQSAVASSVAATFDAAGSWAPACQGSMNEIPPFIPPELPPNPVACAAAVALSVEQSKYAAISAGHQADALSTQRAADKDSDTKQKEIAEKTRQIAEIQQAADYQSSIMECCLDERDLLEDITSCENPGPLMINSEARVDVLMLKLMRAELEAKRQEVEMLRVHGEIDAMRAKAKRIVQDYDETTDQLIAVTAAENDPNVRIYANADILAADESFNDALVDAFRATRTYEYFTATTYAKKGDLFLVRMVNHGTENLEDYLYDLQRDYREFEQTYGRPSDRVAMVSLRDDVLNIARANEKGIALLPAERAAILREELLDPNLLDGNGHIRIPFSTILAETSPITAIHKIVGIEAEIHGSDVGDRVGRIYLTSKGTSTLRNLDDVHQYLRTPGLTAVLNPYFNGVRVFDDDIYRNDRFQGRAFVNTLWELVLNLQDEEENRDINPNSITDIRLYFFYEDFSTL
ncbi:MAG: hypothetical protein GY822_23040 [Deltaproteobacteria bacterium]|nr:hypothetical protein [Deltaproteobacteria bacterium]